MKILCFGIARDIAGGPALRLEGIAGQSVAHFRVALLDAYPAFRELADFAVARNQTYATDEELIGAEDEVVIIPPVSGG